MTLATRDPSALEPTKPAPNSLAIWADSARQAANIAVSLARTPFVPASLRDRDPDVTAANITAAILTGQELGIEPMAALRSIDVIQGTPALRAITLRALVQSAGHEIWVAESTETRAVVSGRRKGSAEVQTSRWTMDRAKALGISTKDNWRKQPGAMLVARASSECARLIGADVILGVAYSVEELEDGVLDTPAPSAESAPTARTARRRTTQAPSVARPPVADAEPEPEPDFEPSGLDEFADAEPEPEPAPPADQRSDAQSKKLWALLNENGLADRDAALAYIGGLGIAVESTKDLTRAQASLVIEALVELGGTS